ncbi:MAG: hypothetical protein HFJ24_00225 [Clostridia bacterium]|nr:hypothetical protein [Clostridia bacterium]MCI9274528.1 hypothetical protein [Clostridia bacterium]
MELKMKYSYSYFIYPYVIQEKNYRKYIEGLMKNKKYKPKFFEKDKNLGIYKFFLPTIREYMFKSFNLAKKTQTSVNTFDDKLRSNLFKESPCVMFEYEIGKNAQAKTGEESGIFFKIEKIEVICFKTGICFLAIKTNIEDTDRFSDLLNFNLKFRDINSETANLEEYRNIKIQTDTFSDIKMLSELIYEITGKTKEAQKMDIDINRFFVYSYVCLDQEYWNETREFAEIEKEFYKFANVLNSEFNSTFDNDKLKTVNLGKYIKVGVSKAGINLLTSSINTVNYTNLPNEFENEYLYAYIFTLYEKFYFAKILQDFKSNVKHVKASKEFVKFTNDVWVHELTNVDNGNLIHKETKEVLELKEVYGIVKEQYDVTYKGFKMKNNDMLNRVVFILLAISIITNIVNFIKLYNLK